MCTAPVFAFSQVVDASENAAPYHLNLNCGFMPGYELTVIGHPNSSGDRFKVDIISQSNNKQDIIFHSGVRFDESTVVRNSYSNGSYGHEERDGGFPFQRGKNFTLNYQLDNDGFQVYVDGSKFTVYRYRQDVRLASHVSIQDAVSVSTLKYKANLRGIIPKGRPVLDIPLQNSFSTGCELTVTGRVEPNVDQFAVTFACGQGPNVDKPLHINPRFNKSVIICNSFLNGAWSDEEKSRHMLIQECSTFTLFIRCEQEGYKIYVDGKLLSFYIHRECPDGITNLEITKGLTIDSVSYHSKMKNVNCANTQK